MRNVNLIFFRTAFLSSFVLLLSLQLNSQSTANYTFGTNTTGSLVLDANGNTIDMSTGTTTLVAASSDQGVSSVSNIGFNFILMGNLYTQFSTSANGILQLGTSVVSGSTYVASGGSVASPKLSAFGGDLQTGSSGKVHSKLIGTAPNRCLVIEFNNMNLYYSSGVFGNDATFQIRLYETSGLIEYVYGTVVVSTVSGSPSDFSPSIGFSTNTTANNLVAVAISTNTSTTTSPFTENPNSVVGPILNLTSSSDGSRRVYSFTPPVAAPTAPTWAAATSITATGMTLNWTDNASNETGYIVLRSTDNTTFTQQGTTLVSGTQTLVVSGLTPGTLYYWKIIAVREGTASEATGNETTLSAAVYYWTGTATAEFNTAATWNTAADGTGSTRSTPLTTDVLIIDGAGTVAGAAITGGTVNASASIGQLKITSSTPVTLTGVTSTRTLTITGGSGDDFEIQAASTLTLIGATAVAFVFTGTGNTGNISGTLTFGGSTSNTLTTTGGTSTLVTVSSSGIINLGVIGLTSSSSTLAFANGSNCNMTGTQTTVPLATWGATSNLNITGIVGGTSVTNGVQTFGNLTYNCSGATGTMSFFTTSTTAVVQGNLTIQATNSGKFRATTSGTLTINGNLILNNGTFEISSSTGIVNVAGNANINGGTFDIAQGGASNLRVAGNFIQTAGTIAQTSSTGTLEFNGSSAQTLTLVPGSHGTNVINVRVNNAAGVDLTSAFSIRNLTISRGNLTGAGNLTYNGTTSLLTYNSTTGNQTASAVEFPSSSGPSALTINNTTASPNNIVTVPFSRTLIGTAGVLTFTAGILDNSTFVLTLTNTATGAISGGSTTTYAKGAIERSLPLSLVSGSTYNFPVGKGSYNPLALVNPTTNSGGAVTVKAEVFDTNAGGTSGTNMGTLNTDRYWAASITAGAGNFTNTFIRLNDASVVTTTAIGTSATLSGAYDIVGSTSPTIVLGTSVTSATTASTSLPGFYVIGLKAVPMVYTSSTVTQSVTTAVIKPAVNQQIIGVQIVTTGNASPLTLTSMDFNTTGSTSPAADISNARVWYTGTSSTFATTTQFGSDIPTPSVPYTVTGSQALAEGTNYFWLVYDVPSGATVDNLLDAECTSVNVGGAQTPAPTTVVGNRIIKAALAGLYEIGESEVPPYYTKLTAAIADLNAYGASAAVIFELQGDYSSSGETFPFQINAFPGNSATNTLTIKPKTGVTAAVSGSSASAIIVINGADYVTIDGSNGSTVNSVCLPTSAASRDLTITNTNTGTSSAVVWLQTAGADGASNNKVINCNLIGSGNTQTLFGVGSGNSTISTTSLGTGNNNNSFVNNNISKTQRGIYSQGASSINKNTGTIINQNLINTASPNNVSIEGIFVGFDNGAVINGNTISNLNGGSTTIGIGLGVRPSNTYTSFTGNEVTGATVSKNILNDIVRNGNGTAIGIIVGAVTTISSSANYVSNNMISGVRTTSATPSDFSAGILVGGGVEGATNVYYNTISLTGVGSNSSPGFGIGIGGSNPVVDLRNNIFVNRMTSTSGKMYAIGLAYSTYSNLTSNNNNFFTTSAPLGVIGGFGNTPGGDQNSLSIWNSTTGKDGASINILPVFTSSTNLHLDDLNPANIPLNSSATTVSVTDDIDCGTRDGSTPDIGADEFNPPSCFSAIGGTASGSTSYCGSGTPTITATGYSTGTGSTYQWYTSTTIGDYPLGGSAVSGQTNPASLTTGTVSGATTYFWLRVTCGTDVSTDNSTLVTITINPSMASISGSASKCTADPAVTWTENGGTGTSWLWSTSATTQSISVSTAGTYTVTVTSPGACIATATKIITVNPNPTGVTATSSASPVCPGASFNLMSSADTPSPNILTQNFESGLGSWTAVNNSTGGTTPALVIWTQRATGYTYSTDNFTAPQGSNFVLANADAAGSGVTALTTISSPSFSTVGYSTVSLNFKHYYRHVTAAAAFVEVSTNGSTWNTVQTYSATTGSAATFATATVNLDSYANSSTLYVRFRYSGAWYYYWAVDDVSISGTPASYTYGWSSNPSGFTSSMQNPTGVSQSIARDYMVTVTGLGGCTSPASVNVGISPAPTTPVITSSLCHGATSVSGTSAEADGTDIEVFVNAVSQGTVMVTSNAWTKTGLSLISGDIVTASASIGGGCPSTLASKTVNALPTPSITGSLAFCAGGSTTLDAGTYSSYLWNGGAVTQTLLVNTASSFTVTVTDSNGCLASTSATTTVNALPTPSITGTLAFCAGGSTTLDAGTYSSYLWTGGAVTQTLLVNTASTFSVTVTDGNGCMGTSSATTTINALPTPSITGTLAFCAGGSTTLDAGTYSSYLWTGGAVTQTLLVNTASTFTVTVTDGNGCMGTTSATTTINTTSIPIIASPICSGATTVSGTSAEANGTTIEVFIDAISAGTTTVTANAWSKTVAALSTTNVITATATVGGCVSGLSLAVTVSPAPVLPSINPGANQICPGTSVTFTAGNGSQYEFFKNAVSLGSPSRTNTYTTAVLANNDEISVRSYSPFTFDGNIVESPWGTALATSAGGPTPGFGAGHEINAVYVQGDANNINMALAGNVQDNNKILLFIDSKSGGYSDGNFGRDNSPDGLVNFNSGTTFDAGFEPDYCLVIGTNGAMNNYFFDLFTLSGTAGSGGGPNTYLGDKTTSFAGAVTGADPLNSSNTRGFEVAIPKLLLGYLSGTVKVMAMYTGNSGFLSNQFLSPAGSGDGNYGSGSVSFGSANPDAVIVPAGNLINNCYSSASVIMQVEGTVVKNSADAGFNTLRSVYNCIIDGGPTPITYDQPTTTTTLLTNPLTINKTLTIMGAGPGNKPEITVDFTGLGMSPGIMIGTGKTVTLADVDIKDINNTNMPNNAVIEVQGTGTLKVTGSTIINKTP